MLIQIDKSYLKTWDVLILNGTHIVKSRQFEDECIYSWR